MKVLQLGASLEGGVSHYIASLINNSTGCDYYIPYTDELEIKRIKRLYGENVFLLKYVQAYKINFFKKLFYLHFVLSNNNIHIIHAHVLRFGFIAALYKCFVNNKIKIVYTGHGSRYTQKNTTIGKWYFKKIEKFINTNSDRIVFIRKLEYDNSIKQGLVCENKTSLITTRINLSEKENININIKKKYNIQTEKVVAMVGTLYDLKNPKLFYLTAKKVIAVNNDVTFIWIGDGSLLSKYRTLTELEGFSEKIKFIGNIHYNEMQGVWKQIDILFQTSRIEIFSLVILESFYSNTLVISSNFEGVECLVEDKVNGLVYNLKNVNEPVSLINQVLNGHIEVSKIIKNAKRDFENKYSKPTLMAEEYLNIYNRI